MIVPALANKGPVLVVKDICTGMVSLGHYCKVFYFDDIVEIDLPCECERIHFWKKVDFSEYDIVHSHCYRSDAYVFLHKSKRDKKTKLISTIHTHIGESLQYYMNPLKRYLLVESWFLFMRKFDVVVVLSDYHRKYYESRKENLGKIQVVFNGRNIDGNRTIDKEDIQIINEFKAKYKIIGAMAVVTKRKGFDQLIKALQYLPEYGFLLIGQGEEINNLIKMAEHFGVKEQLLCIGSRMEAYRYLPLFDIFAMTSRAEGFPLSLIEAGAMGIPTVCSNIPVFTSVVSEKEVSMFNIEDVDSLVEAINKANAKNAYYSENLKDFYLKNFTREAMVSNYLKVYSGSKKN